MKKLLSILIATFFLSNIVTYAQKENNPFTMPVFTTDYYSIFYR